MNLDLIKKHLGEHWISYEEALQKAVASESPLLTQINNYIIHNAGKQLRPALCILSAIACSSNKLSSTTYNCAAVSEMIHTATLLHDDVADNGNIRRGKPTVKAYFNPASSVLAGDYWLAMGLKILTEKCNTEILALFTNALKDLAEGEIIQMDKADKVNTTIEDYYKIIKCKTASLFIAAIKSGACSVNASENYVEALSNFSYHLGIAFQMRDDIFDYSPKMDTGKLSGADLKERKITLPLFCALKNSPAKEKEIRDLISQIDNDFTNNISEKEEQIIATINDFVLKNKGLEDAQIILENHISQAINSLNILPDSQAKNLLSQIAEYVGVRKK